MVALYVITLAAALLWGEGGKGLPHGLLRGFRGWDQGRRWGYMVGKSGPILRGMVVVVGGCLGWYWLGRWVWLGRRHRAGFAVVLVWGLGTGGGPVEARNRERGWEPGEGRGTGICNTVQNLAYYG